MAGHGALTLVNSRVDLERFMTIFTAIDFETADYQRDSACAVATVTVDNNQIVSRYTQFLRPPRSKFIFTYIHGITWRDVEDCPTFAEAWPDLAEIIDASDFMVAHNAPFDKGVLNKCCQAAGIDTPDKRFGCTVKASRAAWDLPSHKLNVVSDHLGIALQHHDASSDAEACAKIAIEAIKLGITI
jgi:DNA polymerase-3 subunit epsilon